MTTCPVPTFARAPLASRFAALLAVLLAVLLAGCAGVSDFQRSN